MDVSIKEIMGKKLSDISCTMFVMLYGRVLESRSQDPILRDPKAEEIVDRIHDSFLRSERKILSRLAHFKVSRDLAVHAAIRAKQYDSYALEFMQEHPGCFVVSLGCGMSTQFWRIDDGRARFFDLDLPEVIEFKRLLVPESERYKMVGCSVLDHGWMDTILTDEKPVIFLAEGLFMYLPKDDVRGLLQAIARRVKRGQLVAELAHEKYTRGFNKRLLAFKLKYQVGLDEPPAYLCGVRDSSELATWSPRWRFMDEWFYMDNPVQKLGWIRVFRRFDSFRKTQWTARYRLGE